MNTNEKLAMQAQAGSREALHQLWKQTERLIQKLMCQYYPLCKRSSIEPGDLQQSGYFALVRAVKDYNPQKKLRFTSYLKNHIANVAQETLGLRGHQSRPRNTVSLDSLLPGTEDMTLADTIEDTEAVLPFEQVQEEWQRSQLREALNNCLDALPPAQANVIHSRFYKGKTLRAISEETGVSIEYVRQLQEKALRELRRPYNACKLWAFREGDIWQPYYTGTGIHSFRSYRASSVERIAERLEALKGISTHSGIKEERI